MGNIYNYSRVALQQEFSRHPFLFLLLLVLLTIPLSYAVNSIALGILVVYSIITYRKSTYNLNGALIIPIAMYLLMVLSLAWSIDPPGTVKALAKELPLLLVPLCLSAAVISHWVRNTIIKYFSWGIVAYCCFYLIKALFRYVSSGDPAVFFYHELVTKDVNAIHVSVYVSVAFFYFFTKAGKSAIEIVAAALLFAMVFLLSSKNIIITFIALIVLHQLFYTKISKRMRLKNLVLFVLFLLSLTFIGQIKERFKAEYETMMTDSSVNDVIGKPNAPVYNVSIKQAWTNDSFQPNDYFPGTAFRVYQFRIFTEMLAEDNIWFTGYGLNASYPKIEQKTVQYNLYLGDGEQEGYQKKNFHNQYIQNFAELGIVGLLLLLAMVFINLKNGIKSKDFVHIAFAVLMISLFLTESFLWRQRGVMFFAVLYSLFNARLHIISEKE